ncbi:MAG: hypothetical protein QXZ49_01045 [Nitrososphaerota archaeon]
MNIKSLVELINPKRLASSFEVSFKLKRAILIYVIAILAAIGSALYYGLYKLKIVFFMPILKAFTPPYTSAWDIILGRIVYVIFGMIIVLFILRLSLMFVKKEGVKFYALISLILHSFLAIVMISVIFFIFAANSPIAEVNIVSATLSDVKLNGVELEGRYMLNNSNIEVQAETINADQIIVTSVFENGTIPNWGEIYQKGITIDLGSLREYITIKSAIASSEGRLLELGDIEVSELKWQSIQFSSISNMLYYPVPPMNFIAGLLSLFSWIWIIGYSVLATKYYYSLTTGISILISIIMFMTLFIFGFI